MKIPNVWVRYSWLLILKNRGVAYHRFPFVKQEDAQFVAQLWHRRNKDHNSFALVKKKTLIARSWTHQVQLLEGKRKALTIRVPHPFMSSVISYWWETSKPFVKRRSRVGMSWGWMEKSNRPELFYDDEAFQRTIQKRGSSKLKLPF